MNKRRLCLPSVEIIKDDKVITDEEIDEWEWKSYHEIDVEQNMGNERFIHENNQINDNAQNN